MDKICHVPWDNVFSHLIRHRESIYLPLCLKLAHLCRCASVTSSTAQCMHTHLTWPTPVENTDATDSNMHVCLKLGRLYTSQRVSIMYLCLMKRLRNILRTVKERQPPGIELGPLMLLVLYHLSYAPGDSQPSQFSMSWKNHRYKPQRCKVSIYGQTDCLTYVLASGVPDWATLWVCVLLKLVIHKK